MAASVWFEDDVKNAIRAAAHAAYALSREDTREAVIFSQGYLSALNTLCAAFGVSVPELQSPPRLNDFVRVLDNLPERHQLPSPK